MYKKLIELLQKNRTKKWYLSLIGFIALLWFLIRVIPKPSRATYPCQRAAFPAASAFVIYISGTLASAFAFRRAKKWYQKSNYLLAVVSVIISLTISVFTFSKFGIYTSANTVDIKNHTPNQPIGEAKGIFPGRVAWVWNPDAVNENCPNTWRENDNWWMEKNTNRIAVNQMLKAAVVNITGETNLNNAWQKIFAYHNNTHQKGNSGYRENEKIAIKTNFVSCDGQNIKDHRLDVNVNMIDVAPQLMWATLHQLVNVCGIAQKNISLGDPSAYFPTQYYDLLKNDFPDVVYLSLKDAEGRTGIVASENEEIQFSNGQGGDYLPTHFVEADYMINISVLKHHTSAGFSQIAKNHYGSNMQNTAEHMHSTLVNQQSGMGHYRHLLDLLAHKHLGGKTILNIGDFLWSGDRAWTPPVKFSIPPFNNDFPSSILVSQDPVAIESVGLDFIQSQNWQDELAKANGVDDYLHQAADPELRPTDIFYDPENDGTSFGSLGVHEHWNNPTDKQYSRNLGTGNGIELIKIHRSGTGESLPVPQQFQAELQDDNSGIKLTWNDNATDETTFIIERSTDGGENYNTLATLDANVEEYVDGSITENLWYYYRIKAANSNTESDYVYHAVQTDVFDHGNIDFRIISFTRVKPEGFPLQFCWNALGADPYNNIYMAVGNDGKWIDHKEDVAIFRFNNRKNSVEFLSTCNTVLQNAENLLEEEYVSKGHTDIVYLNGKMYMGTQPYHQPNTSLNEYRGSHLISYDIEEEKFNDCSKNLPNGVIQQNRGLFSIAKIQQMNYIVGYGNPTGDLIFFNTQTNTIDKVVAGNAKNNNITRVIVPTFDGRVFYSWGWDKMYIYDLETDETKKTEYTGGKPFWNGHAKTYDGLKSYISDAGGTVYCLETNNETLTTIGTFDTGALGIALSDKEDKLYTIAGNNTYKLLEMDIETGEVLTAYTFPDDFGNGNYTFTGNNIKDNDGNIYFARHQNIENNQDGNYDAELVMLRFNKTEELPENTPPTIDRIKTCTTFIKNTNDTILLTGISDGNNGKQQLTITADKGDTRLITKPQIQYNQNSSKALLLFTPRAAGMVTVTIQLTDNCNGTTQDNNITTIDCIIVIEDASTLHKFKTAKTIIYPNPANNKLIIKKSKKRFHSVAIYSTNGKNVLYKKIKAESDIELDISHLKSGIYFIKMFGATQNHQTMFSVE